MHHKTATATGFLAASAFPAGCSAVLSPLSGSHDVASMCGTFLVHLWFTATSALVFGMPIFLALNRLGFVRWWSATGAGAIVGLMSLVVARWTLLVEMSAMLHFAALGAGAGLAFWLFWRVGDSSEAAASSAA